MLNGIYSAAWQMVNDLKRQMVVANNIANVATNGYKQDKPIYPRAPRVLDVGTNNIPGNADTDWSLGTIEVRNLGDVALDLTQGDLEDTGNPLDLAISGDGFFVARNEAGTYYTRDGSFSRDALGRLSTSDGSIVQGREGPITLGQGEVLVEGDGAVSVDGQVVGRIRMVRFPGTGMEKVGNGYLVPADPVAEPHEADGAAINQGFLERSNVDLTSASVEMMAALRSYEANQRMLQLQDQTLSIAVNEIGKV